MGKKSKTSRKGKKAWRANISTEDIEDFFEKTTKDALSGGNLSAAPSEDLFHVDKSHDLPVKRKIEKHRERVLRVDSILKKNPFVQLVPSSKPKLKKSKKTIVIEDKAPKQVQKNVGDDSVMVDLWGDDSKEDLRYFLELGNVGEGENNEDVENEVSEAGNIFARKTKRVTRVELNKRCRQKALRKKETKEKAKEKILNEIDSLPNILEEIAREDEDKQNKHLRRVIAKEEVLKIRPPRLGKYKFEAPPVQVLLTEEMTGSLRKLKACCTLARDRFKSLEKRGILVPSKQIRRF
ncbi:uncharacterized protein At2g40430 isoform X2 [Arabidopsis lyrata subsp. lyrata]|uniref:uncharacterized protein At2g40430 isoform X2 n=1 Tax=Arabidopsis lyrata subsp. lyrata TaxID=81972 RepID=UPI000A29D3BF|nr:uncharacterized protein At2g40430 isoform X2 [Arabidopsis lyrata subsp. lyrata]|eukprot:XP_020884157.1 uncharacterized protein At2g40430 isoform X2 [Arabidopsis lyrata subsp. lyrata]